MASAIVEAARLRAKAGDKQALAESTAKIETLSADRLAVAMESRCYSEDRTDPELGASTADWAALGIVLLFSLFMICS